ncbi:MAG: hypothetical protein JOZ52_07125 [Acidobacteria bacterium]|nr:hypothetical protein [Acidobacteriota bacterium]
MKRKIFTLSTLLVLAALVAGSQGCSIFSFVGCTKGGYVQGIVVRVTQDILHTGCQTLRCPRQNMYDRTANSQGNITYNKDEDGLCWPQSQKTTFTIVGVNLPHFTNLTGSINLNAPPSSITISGWGMDTYYGTPRLQLFDYNWNFIGEETATSVAGDGSWAVFNMQPLTNPWSGTYHAHITRARWDGNYEEIGDVSIDCYGLPRVDEDGDGVYCDQDCNDEDANISPWAAPDCSGYYWDANCNGQYDPFESECQSPGDGCGYQDPHMEQMPCYNY